MSHKVEKDYLEKLIVSWLRMHYSEEDSPEYENNLWAEHQLSRLSHDDPDLSWRIILEILRRDQSPRIVESLAAGAMEDLLSYHGEDFIDKVEQEARANHFFRHLLGGVWQNDMSDEIWNRVQSAAGGRW